MQVIELPLNKLNPDPNQTRVHTEDNLSAIRASLLEHGQVETLLVRKGTMDVIAGNGRLRVMRELGWTTAFCNVVELSDREAKKLSVRMNRTGELAKWDENALGVLIKQMLDEGDNPAEIGFTDADARRLITQIETDLGAFAKPEGELRKEAEDSPKADAKPAGDGNWLYVEFYGQDAEYDELLRILKPIMVSPHQLDPQAFHQMVKEHAARKVMQ